MSASPAARLSGLHGAEQRRPLYSRLPALYFRTPPWVRAAARKVIGVRRRQAGWLLQSYLGRLEALPAADGSPVPLLLTHDVDTAQGYANLPRLLQVEEALGLASLTLLVTHRYPWNPEALAALAERGHCFGVHDTTHDNRLAYLPARAVRERIATAQVALGPLDCGAFRAPGFLRSRALYEGIADLVSIDLSTNDWSLLWPHPGDGIGSPFPARYGNLVCVPTTLPRDGELFALGLAAAERLDLYQRKATQLWHVGAPAVLLTHPDPTFTDSPDRLAAYAGLLRWLTGSGMFKTLMPGACLHELRGRAVCDVGVAPPAPMSQGATG